MQNEQKSEKKNRSKKTKGITFNYILLNSFFFWLKKTFIEAKKIF